MIYTQNVWLHRSFMTDCLSKWFAGIFSNNLKMVRIKKKLKQPEQKGLDMFQECPAWFVFTFVTENLKKSKTYNLENKA